MVHIKLKKEFVVIFSSFRKIGNNVSWNGSFLFKVSLNPLSRYHHPQTILRHQHQRIFLCNSTVEVCILAITKSLIFLFNSIAGCTAYLNIMETDLSYIVQYLRSIVIHSLDSFNLENAEFAAERLVAALPGDPEAVYLYSLVLYRQRKFRTAFNRTAELLENIEHLSCAYIFARLCLELQKYKEGIFRLISVTHLYNSTANSLASSEFMTISSGFSSANTSKGAFFLPLQRYSYEHNRLIYPEESSVYHLLGELYKAQGDLKNSILNYQKALRLNPFDFNAFQQMVSAGAEVSVRAIYRCASGASTHTKGSAISASSAVSNPKAPSTEALNVSNPFSASTALLLPPELSTPRVLNPGVPDAPLRRTHGNLSASIDQSGFFPPSARLNGAKTPTAGPRYLSHVRKKSEAEAPRSLQRNNSASLLPAVSIHEVDGADIYLRRLYSVFAKLAKCFYKYDCYKAIRILESLPETEKDTPWVLSKLGRLHFEIVNYVQSKKFFVRLRQLDRTRLEDMEFYSTLLWHLHEKVELTYLANELHDIDNSLAITWCVMGNLFSLARETDEAMKCFNKAVAIDPRFTYAHTLKGHEYFGNDNYEQALECFRYSLHYDSRHYNALYGIGMVYINLGEYQKADYHFRKAVAINPINIILICCVGMVLEKLGKKTAALRQYELANKLQPLNALPIFKKAQLLFSMQQFPQALKEFQRVKELAPNEASVHFLLGQLYQIQHDKFLAIREFTIALNLDPKGNYLIREAMEMLKEET